MPASEDLVELEADEAGGHGGGGGNGRDDPPSDELGLQLVDFRDAVVSRAHVGEPSYKVHVVVCIVILFQRTK